MSSPDKLLWTDPPITKRGLADYYEAVADRLLEHLADRPVTLHHRPRGVAGSGFIRKHLPPTLDSPVRRFRTWARTARRYVEYAVIETVADLQWCAGQNVVEFHPCLFRTSSPNHLDQVVFDIDPADGSSSASEIALAVRAALDDVDVQAWAKSTGRRGVHVVVPVEPIHEVGCLRRFVNSVSRAVVARSPESVTTEFSIEKRGGRTLLDCSRMSIGATIVSAWSPRASPAAPVGVPLTWGELEHDRVQTPSIPVAVSRRDVVRPAEQSVPCTCGGDDDHEPKRPRSKG